MESTTYQAKRAHWGMTWFAIRKFREVAIEEKKPELEHMTPARFDVLFLIEQRYPWLERVPGDFLPRMHMSELIDRLGLSPSTISKTVTGMVKRGLAQRFTVGYDRRRVTVALTDWGRVAYRMALALLRNDGMMREKLEPLVSTQVERAAPRRMSVAEHRADGLDLAYQRMRTIARGFGYWADDIHEPGFDAMERSPLQHVFNVLRAARRLTCAKNKKTSPSGDDIPLSWGWGAARPFRRSSS